MPAGITYPIATSATPSGRVAKAAFDEFAGDIMTAIDQGPRFDAILLALHGAMVLEHHEDGEGLLLEMVRDKVGRDVPIGVTLDLHANATDRMAATRSASPDFTPLLRLNPDEPPWYGPVCPVVWEGRHREVPPYPDQFRYCLIETRSPVRWTGRVLASS